MRDRQIHKFWLSITSCNPQFMVIMKPGIFIVSHDLEAPHDQTYNCLVIKQTQWTLSKCCGC